jgi:hypothetical protein
MQQEKEIQELLSQFPEIKRIAEQEAKGSWESYNKAKEKSIVFIRTEQEYQAMAKYLAETIGV